MSDSVSSSLASKGIHIVKVHIPDNGHLTLKCDEETKVLDLKKQAVTKAAKKRMSVQNGMISSQDASVNHDDYQLCKKVGVARRRSITGSLAPISAVKADAMNKADEQSTCSCMRQCVCICFVPFT